MARVMEIQSIISSFSKLRASSVIMLAKTAVAAATSLPFMDRRVLFRPFSQVAARRMFTIGDSKAVGSVSNWIPSMRCYSAITPDLKATLDEVLYSHEVVLFMKGYKDSPQCGFSKTVVQILMSLDVSFKTVNILENEALRQGLKDYSNWPTFPQLYINGEFFGGCDITVEAFNNGQLVEALDRAADS